MAIKIDSIKRRFVYDETKLADIDPSLTPEEVMQKYSATYPELTNGKIKENGVVNNELEYEFVSLLDTKG